MSACIEWQGYVNPAGYGVKNRKTERGWRPTTAHRALYEAKHGPVPDGMELDHLCRNRACVNVEHLEVVTRRENLRRSPLMANGRNVCARGHEYVPENTKIRPNGWRRCLTCMREDNARRRH